ncbi:MAG: hypothetical protein AAB227_06420 [Pseudomonadota bacterium]
MLRRNFAATVGSLLLSACATSHSPQQEFFAALSAQCGKSFEGRLVSTDDADKALAEQRLVMEVRACTDDEIKIPFHVGENRSRTWVVTRTNEGLRLKHDHRHEDGTSDKVTMYGGDSVSEGSSTRQEFPVDAYSIDLFTREGLAPSVTNVWAIEATPALFAYELRRENRFFRVEFDLTAPVSAPPPPWGSN